MTNMFELGHLSRLTSDLRSLSVGYAAAKRGNLANFKEGTMKHNEYEAAEVIVIGNAENVIRGAIKGIFFDDCPSQDKRNLLIENIE